MSHFLEGSTNYANSRYTNDENCKTYREENRKKDEIIKQLCKMNPDGITDMGHIRATNSANYQRHESAALQVKMDKLEENLRSKNYELDACREQLAIVRKEKEILRLEAEKIETDNRKLLAENNQKTLQIESFDSLKYRSEFTIKSLQEQYQMSQMKVAELEARIRAILEDKEKSEQGKQISTTKYQNFILGLARLVSVTDINNLDEIMDKLTEVTHENALLNGKIQTFEQKLVVAEEDAKTARETIVKLMRDYEGVGVGQENLRETKTVLQVENTDLKNQLELMKNRQESLQKLYETVSEEREEKTTKLLELELKVREKEFQNQSGETVMKSLIECLAAMLSTPYIPCQPTEAAVKEKVKQMVEKLKEQTTAAETLDQRVLQLQKQFECQYETGKQLLDKSRDADSVKQELENQIKTLENDLMAQEVLRDNIKCEQERVTKHVFRLADMLQIDYLPSDTDVFGLMGLLQERCAEVLQSNGPNFRSTKCQRCAQGGAFEMANSDSQKHARRITQLKEELEGKDVHIKVLERRLTEQQGSTVTTDNKPIICRTMEGSETSREKAHRLQHQLERSQCEIDELRRALVQSQNSEYEIHKQDHQKQQQELDQLSETIDKLDKVRQKQAKKISMLKSVCEDKTNQLQSNGKAARDLKQARLLLEETRRNEMELCEFREMIGGILGVDLRCSPNPTQEVISKIQNLQSMAQSSTVTPFTPYYLSQDMSSGFQSGYNQPLPALSYNSTDTNSRTNPINCHPTHEPALSTTHGSTNNSTFLRRQQVPKSRIAFQPPNNRVSNKQLNRKQPRARSTSPVKMDERKY